MELLGGKSSNQMVGFPALAMMTMEGTVVIPLLELTGPNQSEFPGGSVFYPPFLAEIRLVKG